MNSKCSATATPLASNLQSWFAWTASTAVKTFTFISWFIIKCCLASAACVLEMVAVIYAERNEAENSSKTQKATRAGPLLTGAFLSWNSHIILVAKSALYLDRLFAFLQRYYASCVIVSPHLDNSRSRGHHLWLTITWLLHRLFIWLLIHLFILIYFL